jgi:hypothetical protein
MTQRVYWGLRLDAEQGRILSAILRFGQRGLRFYGVVLTRNVAAGLLIRRKLDPEQPREEKP